MRSIAKARLGSKKKGSTCLLFIIPAILPILFSRLSNTDNTFQVVLSVLERDYVSKQRTSLLAIQVVRSDYVTSFDLRKALTSYAY